MKSICRRRDDLSLHTHNEPHDGKFTSLTRQTQEIHSATLKLHTNRAVTPQASRQSLPFNKTAQTRHTEQSEQKNTGKYTKEYGS